MRLISLLRLVRFPLVFTAVADSWAGYWIALAPGRAASWRSLATLAAASGLVYAFGMALNDLADRERDRTLHPDRPIPSGALSLPAAAGLCLALAALGFSLLASLPKQPLATGTLLLLIVIAYDLRLNRSAAVGALAMGACRSTNLFLGAALAGGSVPVGPAAILGTYVAVLTLLSTLEEGYPGIESWTRRLLLGILPLDALLVGIFSGRWVEAGLILALLAPRLLFARLLPVN